MPNRLATAALITTCILAPSAPAAGELAAADYVALLKGRGEAVTSFRGTAAMKAYGATEGSFAAAFAYVPPDRGRLELSTPLTGTLLVVTAQGDDVLLFYPGDNVAVVAAGGDETLAFMPGGSGGFFQLVDWLAGRPPLYEEEVGAGTVALSAEPASDGRVSLTWRLTSDGSRLQQVTLSAESHLLLGARLFDADEAAFDVTYGDWREVGEATMPYAITFKAEDTVVEIAVKKLEVGVEMDDEAFSTAPPEGATVMDAWPEGAEFYEGE